MNILLLTASVDAKLANPIHTKLTNTNERLIQYKDTLRKYITESHFNIFVFCENTGFNMLENDLVQLAQENNKSIEFLSFISDIESVKKLGKGYGEGECIEYALKNSIHLQDESICFFKVTGRLYIENINEIIKHNKNKENCFFTDGINSKSVRTVFFKTQVSFFNQNLLLIYKDVNDSKSKFLEYIYFEYLIYKKIDGLIPYPFIIGNSGSTGNPYIASGEYKKMKYLNMLGFYSLTGNSFLKFLLKIYKFLFSNHK